MLMHVPSTPRISNALLLVRVGNDQNKISNANNRVTGYTSKGKKRKEEMEEREGREEKEEKRRKKETKEPPIRYPRDDERTKDI